MESEEKSKPIRHTTYIGVWIGLLILTGITVAVSGMDLGRWAIMVALMVAAVKSGLVLGYFMHLKYEKGRLLQLMIPLVLGVLTIFIGLTFLDVAYR